MFVEKKKNKSGSTTVRVMDKIHGKRKCVNVIGSSRDEDEIAMLVKRGGRWIEERQHGMPLFEPDDEAKAYDKILAGQRQSQILLVGQEHVNGTMFDSIGYNRVKTPNNNLFLALVEKRLYHPVSNLKTAEYMERYMHKRYSVDTIYHFLDELSDRGNTSEQVGEAEDESNGVKWQEEQETFEHTRAEMGGQDSRRRSIGR